MKQQRTPILIGESGATVVRILHADGSSVIEKFGPAADISAEAAVMNWCAGRLPVARVIEHRAGLLIMSELPGVNLTEAPFEDAVEVMVEALRQLHAVPIADCPFDANWSLRLREAEQRIHDGLVDGADFDDENQGRSGLDILAELKSFAPLPAVLCFTHGDACLPNFLSRAGRLSGMVDWGRAGVTHPAQDWALALRSVHCHFGPEGERRLLQHLPVHCDSKDLLRRFRLLDELF